jgi:UTP--glucose-1-phosphate uridylyltransferase
MKAVIPAAGLGTRFLPATKAQPKEMLPVFNKPTIQYVVEEAVASGIDDILIITGKGKRSIEDHFDRSFELEYFLDSCGKEDDLKEIKSISEIDADIYYVRQKKQKGLGDAILCAKKHIDGDPFAVLLGDIITQAQSSIPCTKQLMNIYNKYESSTIAIEEVSEDKIDRYGIIKGFNRSDRLYKIEGMVEKPSVPNQISDLAIDGKYMAIAGRYILVPEIFDHLKKVKPGVGEEIQLTDAIKRLDDVYGYLFDGEFYDIGNTMDWLKSSIEIALKDEKIKEELREYLIEILKK